MDAPRLSQIDLNLLFTLHEVGRCGSVTAAARSLGRTQPAISTRLRQLEQQLGVALLERSGPTLRFTNVGRAVLEEAAVVVAQLGAVVDRTRGLDLEPVGALRIGALPTLCAYLLAPIAVRMTREYPRLRVEMVPGHLTDQLRGISSGELDVLVTVGPIRAPGLSVRSLGDIEACLVVPSGVRVPRGRLSVAQVARFEFVSYGKTGDPFFDSVNRFLERSGLVHRVRIEVAAIQAMKQTILAGGGVGILPRYTVVESTLKTRELEGIEVNLPLTVATRPKGEDVPGIRKFLAELAAR